MNRLLRLKNNQENKEIIISLVLDISNFLPTIHFKLNSLTLNCVLDMFHKD